MLARLYRTDYPDQHRIHAIDGLQIVFHRPSGSTHFLDSPLPEMLSLLAERPMPSDELCRRLCAKLDLPCDEEALQVVEARLAELVASGLALQD